VCSRHCSTTAIHGGVRLYLYGPITRRYTGLPVSHVPAPVHPVQWFAALRRYAILLAMAPALPLLLSLLLFVPVVSADEPGSGVVSAADWAQPRSGERLLSHPALAGSVRWLDTQPDSRLQLRFRGGDENTLRAREIRAWLVALGVASSRVELLPDGGVADGAVEVEVVAPPERGG